ncbi:Neutral amino acid permease protein [Diaporthe eres]|nr:Neutral amino acid permease protein [Diaporthe eres]
MSIVWQFSQISTSYQGHLAQECRSRQMPLADGEMWQQWLSSYTPPNGSGPIFIVLDGIDQINFDHQGTDEKARIALRKIIQDVSRIGKGKLDIRLLLSCNEGYVAARVP